MGKTFPSKLHQELWAGIFLEKDHFLCEQAMVFHPDGLLQML
jgi:hypothetical protein